MKPPPFEYLAAGSLAEAVAALAADEDAKVIAGGQSLMPLLALRLARPSLLVDITRIGLDHVVIEPPGAGAVVRIGATVRQRRIEVDSDLAAAVPLLAEAVSHVGYLATRNRGTLGGSLAHSDPVAELPTVAVALGGSVVATGPGGRRRVACGDLSDGFFTTTLAPDEVLTEIVLPRASARHGAAWCEWAPRAHDFADAGVGVALDVDDDGNCVAVHAAACGVGGRPLPLGETVASAGVLGAGVLGAGALGAGASGAGASGAGVSRTRGDGWDGGSPGEAEHSGVPVSGGSEVSPALLNSVAAAVRAACAEAGDADKGELAGMLAARAVRIALARAGAGVGAAA